MEFDAPVTVTGGRRRRRQAPAFSVPGKLTAISASGAFFALGRELDVGDRIVIFVHCEHPTNGQVRIRFPADVVRVERRASAGTAPSKTNGRANGHANGYANGHASGNSGEWDIAVRFRGRHRFFLMSPEGVPVQ